MQLVTEAQCHGLMPLSSALALAAVIIGIASCISKIILAVFDNSTIIMNIFVIVSSRATEPGAREAG